MNLLVDEGVDGPIVERLRHDGHDVIYVAELSPGIDDPEVLKRANEADALLMTADKDFGELVYRRGAYTVALCCFDWRGCGQPRRRKSWQRCWPHTPPSSPGASPSSVPVRCASAGNLECDVEAK
jgi:hypothetical protein